MKSMGLEPVGKVFVLSSRHQFLLLSTELRFLELRYGYLVSLSRDNFVMNMLINVLFLLLLYFFQHFFLYGLEWLSFRKIGFA